MTRGTWIVCAYFDFHDPDERFPITAAGRGADGAPLRRGVAGGGQLGGSLCAPRGGCGASAGVCRGTKVLDALQVVSLVKRKHGAVADATALLDLPLVPGWQQARAELAKYGCGSFS